MQLACGSVVCVLAMLMLLQICGQLAGFCCSTGACLLQDYVCVSFHAVVCMRVSCKLADADVAQTGISIHCVVCYLVLQEEGRQHCYFMDSRVSSSTDYGSTCAVAACHLGSNSLPDIAQALQQCCDVAVWCA